MSDGAPLESWVGRERVEEDELSLSRARALSATLDRDPEGLQRGSALPAGWHWIYFNPVTMRSTLGVDGHAQRGGFLPPVPLPRRMWAGGRIRFPGILRLGETVTRTSTIRSVREKEGRTGPLVFVTVAHRIESASGVAVEEEQDLVYRTPAPAGSPGVGVSGSGPAGPARRDWSEPYSADAVTLFRFSALTFNGHRIHYDHPYTTAVEGYAGLVVHGPLIALLLLNAGVRRWGGAASAFRYRAVGPLFCDEHFELVGARSLGTAAGGEAREGAQDDANLWAVHPERGVAMEARLESSG